MFFCVIAAYGEYATIAKIYMYVNLCSECKTIVSNNLGGFRSWRDFKIYLKTHILKLILLMTMITLNIQFLN